MNHRNLITFYWIVKLRSITAASQHLNLTQPAISKQLQNLEDELGQSLLNRSSKGIHLTKHGKTAFDFAETFFTLEQNMYQAFQDMSEQDLTVNIAMCKNCMLYEPIITAELLQQYPQVQFKIDTFNSAEIVKKVLQDEYQCGILLGEVSDDVKSVPIGRDTLSLFGNQEAPDFVMLTELEQLTYVLREPESVVSKTVADFFLANCQSLNTKEIQLRSNSNTILESIVSQGNAYSFFPLSHYTRGLLPDNLKPINILGANNLSALNYAHAFVYRHNYQLNVIEQAIIDKLYRL